MIDINEYINKLTAYNALIKAGKINKDPVILKEITDQIYYKLNGNNQK